MLEDSTEELVVSTEEAMLTADELSTCCWLLLVKAELEDGRAEELCSTEDDETACAELDVCAVDDEPAVADVLVEAGPLLLRPAELDWGLEEEPSDAEVDEPLTAELDDRIPEEDTPWDEELVVSLSSSSSSVVGGRQAAPCMTSRSARMRGFVNVFHKCMHSSRC